MLNSIRIEQDMIGIREISNEFYYGIHTLRAIENFKISKNTINDYPELIKGMVMVKKASALANKHLKVLSEKNAKIIVRACDCILKKQNIYLDQFPVDAFQGGAGTSVNMNVNEVLTNIGLEIMGKKKGDYKFLNPNDHLNLSQSTNDAYPTGLRLSIYKSIYKLIKSIILIEDSFYKKSKEFSKIIKMGRTQLQDAVPMTLGQEFYAFKTSLKKERINLINTSKLLLDINLGGTAIGTKLNTPKGYQKVVVKQLSIVSGIQFNPVKDLIESTYDCGIYTIVHGNLKNLAIRLSKICNDLRLLSSGPRAGLNEINLPELQAGSSIMPAKVNPVLPEVVNQVCFKVCGNDICVMMAAESGQLQLNAMEPVISQSIFESINILKNAILSLKEKCIDGITANKKICESYVLNSIGIVAYLNPFIGHHNGDIIGKICSKSGRSVKEVVLEKGFLTEKELNDIFSFNNLIHPKYKNKNSSEDLSI
ncbi:aspA [Wigglesworthia glossinidia endosymbiont of Glossina brevipalpis]|uniref:Aspartate ammonia-lyase n=1 Tax=Wigglesworthia glossinidia brevipalpis TaxID=36870 RepID=Q8D2F9_WIGBR|nr:aspA [Wigglesworthia glossinidia endosymbiont of Glossina brevipalpis]